MRKVPRQPLVAMQGARPQPRASLQGHRSMALTADGLQGANGLCGANWSILDTPSPPADLLSQVYHNKARHVLGKGAHGEVRVLELRSTGEWHAAKYFTHQTDGEHEADLLKDLQHPGIIKLKQVYMPTHARAQIVLTFPTADTDLYRLMQRRPDRRLSDILAASLARQLAAALAYMHSQRVVHRDLKPENLLLVVDGDRDGAMQLQITDFGHARRLPDAKPCRLRRKVVLDASNCLPVNARCALTPGLCTPNYSAPEAYFKLQPAPQAGKRGGVGAALAMYGAAADIWSFGAIVFEMVLGTVFAQCTPQCSAELVAYWMRRIGAPAAELRQQHNQVFQSADKLNLPSSVLSVRDALAAVQGTGDDVGIVLQATLQWHDKSRPMAEVLLREFAWLRSAAAVQEPIGIQGRDAPAMPSQALAAPSQVQGTPATASQTTEAPRQLQKPIGDTPVATSQARCTLAASQGEVNALAALQGKLGGAWPERCCKAAACQCSGHCYQPRHRYQGGCKSEQVAEGSRFCYDCKCSVPTCTSGRLRGELCYQHSRILQSLPVPLQMVRLTQSKCLDLVPCDIADFLEHFSRIRHDPVLVIITALLKEPAATAVFLSSLPEQYTCQDLGLALKRTLQSVSGAPHKEELEQLNRQGSRSCFAIIILLRCRAVMCKALVVSFAMPLLRCGVVMCHALVI